MISKSLLFAANLAIGVAIALPAHAEQPAKPQNIQNWKTLRKLAKYARPVRVTGTATRKVAADRVSLQFTVEAEAGDAGATIKALKRKLEAISNSGNPEDLEATDHTIASLNVYQRTRRVTRNGQRIVEKYFIGNMGFNMTFKIKGDVLEAVANFADDRVTRVSNMRFSLSDEAKEKHLGELKKQALDNARAKAEKRAAMANARLGRVINSSIHEPNIRHGFRQQKMDITVTTRVTYELKPDAAN